MITQTRCVGDRQVWPTADERNEPFYQRVFQFYLDGKVGAQADTGGEIYTLNQGETWFLTWTDFVANSWLEEYEALSEAIARLAVLTACAEGNYDQVFKSTPQNFALDAFTFCKDQLA